MINGESYKRIVAEAAKNSLGLENIQERVFIVRLVHKGGSTSGVSSGHYRGIRNPWGISPPS